MVANLTSLFASFIIALGLTILIEWGLSWFFVRHKNDRQIVILMQCVTNPLLNLLILLNNYLNVLDTTILLVILEALVVISEAIIYKKTFHNKAKLGPFWLSLVLNATSFTVGEAVGLLLDKN